MPDILLYALIVLAVIVVILFAYAFTRPDTFHIRRSADIAAPAGRIFPLIANLKSMNTWSPFADPDPNIKISYSGPESGVGAAHAWVGNAKVGEGRIEITEVHAPDKVAMRLQIVKPMRADNRVEFTLQPNGNATNVTWQMSGKQPFLGKIVTLFIDCDKMVGREFDKGLANLKAIAEG